MFQNKRRKRIAETPFPNLIFARPFCFDSPQYAEDLERMNLIDDALHRLSDCVAESPIHSVTAGRSSSRELSGTLKVMKRVEQVFQGNTLHSTILNPAVRYPIIRQNNLTSTALKPESKSSGNSISSPFELA